MPEKKLFQIVDQLGAGEFENMHILDTTDHELTLPVHVGDATYRIYHSDGYCFDIKSEVVEDDKGNKSVEYAFFAEWDGFKKITIAKAIKLIEKYI